MKSDKPFKKSFICGGILFTVLFLYRFVSGFFFAGESLNVFWIGNLLAGCLVPALITAIWARDSQRSWSWGRYIGAFVISYLVTGVIFSFAFIIFAFFPITFVPLTMLVTIIVLLVRRRIKTAAVVFAISIVSLACFIFYGQSHQRSSAGHIIRFFKGEHGAEQKINDLAEDIRNTPSLSQLQSWGMETLRRFREGQVQTNGYPLYWEPSDGTAVRLARQERPEFIKHQWGETNEFGEEEPELTVVLATNGQPAFVAINWYLHGIIIGSPEYRMPYESWYGGLYVEAKPGVYVYHGYK